jgi:hypothetical protein
MIIASSVHEKPQPENTPDLCKLMNYGRISFIGRGAK